MRSQMKMIIEKVEDGTNHLFFTEQGIVMLSAVLRSDVAVRISIYIMKTFVEMRKYMTNTTLLYERVNEMEMRQISFQKETSEIP